MEASPGSRTAASPDLGALVRKVGGRFGARAGVWSLTVVLAASAGAILAAGVGLEPGPLPPVVGVAPLVAVLYLLGERFPVHLRVRRETHTFSLTEIPLVVGLCFMSPLAIVLAQALGAGITLIVHRRNSVMRLSFNLANFAFSTTCAAWLFHTILGGQDPLGPVGLGAAYAAAVVADQFSGLGVALAIWLSGGDRPEFREHVGLGTLYTFVDASLALVGVIVLATYPEGLWLLAVPLVTTLLGFRLYQDERLKRENLSALQESTRRLQEEFDSESMTSTLLRQIREMFNVQVAALVTLPRDQAPGGITALDLDDALTFRDTTEADAVGDLASLLASTPDGMIVPDPADLRSLRWLEAYGPGAAIVAPLRDEDGLRGALVAGARLANAGPFRADHLSLFVTLTNHAAVAMKNGYLVDQLRAEAQLTVYQAHHDALTGLPNRTLFQQRLEEALRAGDSKCAVLLLDIDRFKEVNDTLGHHNGDRLLVELASRLVECVGDTGLVARLSGDEFGVLVAQPGTEEDSIEAGAVRVARAVTRILTAPFQIEGLELVVTASIGISLSPSHASTAEGLIRRADVAMYNAKRENAHGYEVYRPDRDEYSAARLALVADLRAAVETDQIEVAYQLQVNAVTGRPEGAEALVRWRHPGQGVIMPGDFIGLAETSGLIRPLTERVLRLAVRDAVAWRRRWPDLRVAVNLSPRVLVDASLAPLIRTVLAQHAMPPSALTLEITESAMLDDVTRVEQALDDLTSLGCEIAIDDFGTGYSSFSNLRRLPVHELKIDRSFVSGMATDPSDEAIVELTIDLAHRLGKRVVAEGVETDSDAQQLAAKGCDVLQGYLISRPISHASLMEQIEGRAAADGARGRPDPAPSVAGRRAATAPVLRRLDSVS